jgi:hypothetical protein
MGRTSGTMSSAAFWRLVDRLQIPDPDALELIGYAGTIGETGKRPGSACRRDRRTWRLTCQKSKPRYRQSARGQRGCDAAIGRHHSQGALR